MNADFRQRLVRRLDVLFFIGLLTTSGLAAILFWTQFFDSEEADVVAQPPSATITLPPTLIATATRTPTATPTNTATDTATPTNTATATQTSTATMTAVPPTLTLTSTLWPAPMVAPLSLAETYAGEPLTITGTAQANDTIQVYDQDDLIASTIADDDGEWSVSLPGGLAEGAHQLSAIAIGPGGTESQPVPIPFQVANAPTLPPTNTLLPPTATPTLTPPTSTRTSTPVLPTKTAIPPTPTQTWTPSATRTLTKTALPPTLTHMPPAETIPVSATATASLTPLPVSTATLEPLAAPQIDALDAEMSIFEPVTISGLAEPGATINLFANDVSIGQTIADQSGLWSLDWQATLVGPVLIGAVASNESGQESPVVMAQTELIAPRPRIDAPAHSDVVSPGTIIVRGVAAPGETVEVMNKGAGTRLAVAETADDGTWQTSIVLNGAGKVTLAAVMSAPDGSTLASDPVMITLAPPVQPNTGGVVTADPEETGRTFTALIALLLSAGGFSTYFAGRLLFMLAHDRIKPH